MCAERGRKKDGNGWDECTASCQGHGAEMVSEVERDVVPLAVVDEMKRIPVNEITYRLPLCFLPWESLPPCQKLQLATFCAMLQNCFDFPLIWSELLGSLPGFPKEMQGEGELVGQQILMIWLQLGPMGRVGLPRRKLMV